MTEFDVGLTGPQLGGFGEREGCGNAAAAVTYNGNERGPRCTALRPLMVVSRGKAAFLLRVPDLS